MRKLKKIFLAFIFLVSCSLFNKSIAQKGEYDTLKVYAWVSPEGDTLPLTYLSWITVETHRVLTAQERKRKAEWTRLRNAVYLTFPYALASSKIMNEINVKLVGVKERSDRRAIIKTREKELRKEFADRLTNLSIYQGKVLMKLIYRQSGNSCYEIIKDYKGGFSATFYQAIALIVGTNLKQSYEAQGKDYEVEQIVQEVERMYGLRG